MLKPVFEDFRGFFLRPDVACQVSQHENGTRMAWVALEHGARDLFRLARSPGG